LLPHISKILQAEFVGIISAYRRAVKALCLLRKQCYLMCSATRHDRSVTDTRFAFFTRDQLYGHSLCLKLQFACFLWNLLQWFIIFTKPLLAIFRS